MVTISKERIRLSTSKFVMRNSALRMVCTMYEEWLCQTGFGKELGLL